MIARTTITIATASVNTSTSIASFPFLVALLIFQMSVVDSRMPTILVTGGNGGIGLALCKQLVQEDGAKVLLGARNRERGAAAVQAVKEHCGSDSAAIEHVLLDVADDDSVRTAVASLTKKGIRIDAIVNNAACGYAEGTDPAEIINTNLMGHKRVVENCMPLFVEEGARIINVGSGFGPGYVKEQSMEWQKILCSPDVTWQQIEQIRDGPLVDPKTTYRMCKALLASYTLYCAKKYPRIMSFCITPGKVDTPKAKGYDGAKKPSQGTVSIRHCLFKAEKEQSGWYFGSDAQRSPLHFLRNPGEPAFDGVYPWEET